MNLVWTKEEDRIVREHVEEHGTKDWSVVADMVPRFRPKDVRDRWYNYLAPSLSHQPWTAAEDKLLLEMVRNEGKKFAKLCKRLPGRSGQMCKDRFNKLTHGASVGGTRRSSYKRSRYDSEDEDEDEDFDELDDEELADDDDGDYEASLPTTTRSRSVTVPVAVTVAEEAPRSPVAEEYDTGSSSSSSEEEKFAMLGDDFLEPYPHGLTPYQGHVVSMMSSPFGGFQTGNAGMTLHNSPGVLQKRLFSPTPVPEKMTPARPGGEFADMISPSSAAFFRTPQPARLARPYFAPVSQSRRSTFAALNQKVRDTPRGALFLPVGEHMSPPSNAVAASGLSGLPPLTLFNGARENPCREALELIRRSDKSKIFDDARLYLKKCRIEDDASHGLMIVAAAGEPLSASSPQMLNTVMDAFQQD